MRFTPWLFQELHSFFAESESLLCAVCDCVAFSCIYAQLPVGTELDSLLLTACDFKQHFVIEAQSEFRHPWQDYFELDAAHYFTAQYAAIGTHLHEKEQKITLNIRSVHLYVKKCIIKYFLTDMISALQLNLPIWLQKLTWKYTNFTSLYLNNDGTVYTSAVRQDHPCPLTVINKQTDWCPEQPFSSYKHTEEQGWKALSMQCEK